MYITFPIQSRLRSKTLYQKTKQNKTTGEGELYIVEEVETQPSTKIYRQLRIAGDGKGGLPQGEAHQLVVAFQIVSSINTHTGCVKYSEEVIFRNKYAITI